MCHILFVCLWPVSVSENNMSVCFRGNIGLTHEPNTSSCLYTLATAETAKKIF